jgi:hypothetical protein
MKLVTGFNALFGQFAPCFAQDRSFQRAEPWRLAN